MFNSSLTYALAYQAAGLSVIPIRPGTDKRPAIAWTPYQSERAGVDTIRGWFGDASRYGLAVVCGGVSGDLEMTEIEGRAAHALPDIRAHLEAAGHAAVWEALSTGWVEESPSGGVHWIYRLSDAPVPGNTKIARNGTGEVLAETRGEGGYFIAAPTDGSHHPSGNPWVRVSGDPSSSVPTLSAVDRGVFHAALAAVLDESPAPIPATPAVRPVSGPVAVPAPVSVGGGGVRPGDAIEPVDWAEILTPHGWTLHSTQSSGERFWTRPGKDPRDGHSASTGYASDRDRLWVFSSSVPGFEADTSYTKFKAYSILNHSGDDTAAARALGDAGYGERVTSSIPARGSAAEPAGAVLAQTEYGLALTFLATHADVIRYNTESGRFYHWDGTRWVVQPDTGGAVMQLYLSHARSLDEGDREAARFKRHALSQRGAFAVLALTKSDPRITCTTDDFDAHPWELNTPSGIVDLCTGALGPHVPARMHSKMTRVAPADSPAPVWERFLRTTFAGDEALTRYMQRVLGYSATGAIREHLFVFAYGTGGNGKSVLYDAAVDVLGDYATVAPAGFLMRTSAAGHPTDLADLKGRRLVVGSEVNQGDKFDEARLKALTGGDRIKARYMHRDFFTFEPTHHLHLMGNHQPTIEAGGASVWRRMNQVPFTHTVSEDERDERLPEKLRLDEAPQILAWIIAGAVAYAQAGLQPPAAVRAATEEYRESQDTTQAFLEARCSLYPGNPHYVARVNRVRTEYLQWCRLEGVEPLSSRAFATAVKAHGVLVGQDAPRSGRERLYGGMRLNSDDERMDANYLS